MQIRINCKEVSEKSQLHQIFAQALRFPDWYGGNLDALFDMLTGICEPTEIIVTDFDALTASLGSYANAFRRVLSRADEENEFITFKI
ncbi:MAG: hypothetical protein E7501_03545 [Ruminococcus sp.]|nr:hypothetical protein [Ruminococcus sp.]